jgi:hypothetical protein
MYRLKYFEVSATSYQETHNIFQTAVEKVCKDIDENKYDLTDPNQMEKFGIRKIPK